MIKKIKIEDVRLGMYIHEIRGNWLEHPFWRKSFKLDNPKDLEKLIDCDLDEIWIDTRKGLDVATTVDQNPEEPQSNVKPAIDAEPQKIKRNPAASVSIEEELESAKKIHSKAKTLVTGMFHEARMGNAFEIEEAAVLVDEVNQSLQRNPNALLSLVRLKNADEYTYLHSVAVCMLMVALAKQLKLNDEQIKQAGVAGLLHDVGKMAIPNEVLNKAGKLTDEEFNVVRASAARF